MEMVDLYNILKKISIGYSINTITTIYGRQGSREIKKTYAITQYLG